VLLVIFLSSAPGDVHMSLWMIGAILVYETGRGCRHWTAHGRAGNLVAQAGGAARRRPYPLATVGLMLLAQYAVARCCASGFMAVYAAAVVPGQP
jgi:hypothetical protein